MPDREELEQLMEQYLDAMEVSKLHQMADAAAIMDAHDKEEMHGNQEPIARLG